jgi:D-glycero-D-manno-heptose 1,7-bisphosphate phosphatase
MIKQCVVLLGGLGTRLGDLTRDMPKPLLEVAGRPFVDILVHEALRRGFTDILLLAGHAADVVEDYALSRRATLPAGARLEVIVETEPLGTG